MMQDHIDDDGVPEQDQAQQEPFQQQQQDEEDEQDDDDGPWDLLVEDHEQHAFNDFCNRIEEDDPELTGCFREEITSLNNRKAVQLGRALLGNTQMVNLSVRLMVPTDFTSLGATALVEGILGSQIKTLCLRGQDELPLEMAQLCAAKSLTSFDLRFPLTEEFSLRLYDSLRNNLQLKNLTIQIHDMTPREAKALASVVRCSPIVSLAFIALSTSDNIPTATVMTTLYLDGVQACQNIKNLILHGVVGDIGAMIAVLPKLCQLVILNVVLSLTDVELLTNGIRQTSELHSLCLSGCELGNAHMRVLSSGLGNNKNISKLELNNNKIGDEGIARFVEQWGHESGILQLNLENNQIGATGGQLLVRALANHPNVYVLNLASNKAIGYEGLKLIGEELPGKEVCELYLCSTANWVAYEQVTCEAAVIQEAKRLEAIHALLEGVRGNVHLLVLHRSDLHLSHKFREELDVYLYANYLGRRQLLEQENTLPPGVLCHFLVKGGMNRSCRFLFLREVPNLIIGRGESNNIGKKRGRDS